MNDTPAPKFELKADGIYVADTKVGQILNVGGKDQLRMSKGFTDIRAEAEHFIANLPAGAVIAPAPEPPVSKEPDAPVVDVPGDPGAVQAPAPAPAPAPSVVRPIPDKPIGHPRLGQKDPAVIAWYREYRPAEFKKRYPGIY